MAHYSDVDPTQLIAAQEDLKAAMESGSADDIKSARLQLGSLTVRASSEVNQLAGIHRS